MKICFNLLFICLLVLSGCAQQASKKITTKSNPPQLQVNHALFQTKTNSTPTFDSLFQLTDEQKQFFLSDYKLRLEKGSKPHEALADFMSIKFQDFNYYGETYDASTAILNAQGNCMSLAMITSAYAKLVGLEYDYKMVNSQPIFDKQNGYLLVSSHVQSRLFDPTFQQKKGFFNFTRPMIVVDYFSSSNNYPGRVLLENTFIAMYYVNLAAQAIVAGDIEHAFNLSMEALKHDNQYSGAVNLLAILHKKKGDYKTAEALYNYGLFYDENNVRLLSNYVILLKSQGRMDDVSIQQSRLDKLDDPNPYAWLEQAYVAQSEDQQRQAIKYYKKALDIAPYLQPAYQGLYQIYLENNRKKEAKAIIKQALNWSHEPDERQRYKYKLYYLAQ